MAPVTYGAGDRASVTQCWRAGVGGGILKRTYVAQKIQFVSNGANTFHTRQIYYNMCIIVHVVLVEAYRCLMAVSEKCGHEFYKG